MPIFIQSNVWLITSAGPFWDKRYGEEEALEPWGAFQEELSWACWKRAAALAASANYVSLLYVRVYEAKTMWIWQGIEVLSNWNDTWRQIRVTDRQMSGVNSPCVDPWILDVLQYARTRGEYLGGLPSAYTYPSLAYKNINLGKKWDQS